MKPLTLKELLQQQLQDIDTKVANLCPTEITPYDDLAPRQQYILIQQAIIQDLLQNSKEEIAEAYNTYRSWVIEAATELVETKSALCRPVKVDLQTN